MHTLANADAAKAVGEAACLIVPGGIADPLAAFEEVDGGGIAIALGRQGQQLAERLGRCLKERLFAFLAPACRALVDRHVSFALPAGRAISWSVAQ